mgnify:CR=1 FL=1
MRGASDVVVTMRGTDEERSASGLTHWDVTYDGKAVTITQERGERIFSVAFGRVANAREVTHAPVRGFAWAIIAACRMFAGDIPGLGAEDDL